VSWRIISAIIMLHGDDRGLVIPPRIAPIQVVIVPIYYKEGDTAAIAEKAAQVSDQLRKAGLTVHVDTREQYTPGWKFNEWELKGVPLRVEIGPKDLEKRQVTIARRDNSKKTMVPEDTIVQEVTRILEDIQKNLYARAKTALDGSISTVMVYDEFKRVLDQRGGFIRSCWCGVTECEDGIRTESGATIRTIPLQPENTFSDCVRCGKPATKVVYFARAY